MLPLLADDPPVLCDWLPWNHTFGGNHNFGIVLYNGGTLYIDDGKPTPEGFETTIANLKDVATTAYFNVPRGYDLLVPRLRADREFRLHFFSRLKMLFCAAASLRQQVADDLDGGGARRARNADPARHRPRRHRERAVRALRGRRRLHGRPDRRAGSRRRAQAGAGRRQARGPAARAEHHAGLLARRGADARGVRRRRLLQARRRARFRRSRRIRIEGLRVRGAVVRRLQAVDRHVGARRAAAHGAARAPRRPRPRRRDCRARSRFRRGADLSRVRGPPRRSRSNELRR